MVTRAKKKPNTDEIATYQNDITQYYIGRVLINPDTVLSTEAAGQGLKVYAELERDDRVYSEMQKRKLAVIGKEWSIEPASEDTQDVKIAEFVENNFKEIKFDRACEELLDGILMGFKASEIMWDYSEGDIWIKEFRGRDSRRFTFGLENQLRLLTYKNMLEGEEVPDRKFQLFRFGEKNNNPFGMGLGNKLYWPVWFKKNGVKFWAVFLEKFGQPTPWGKYPPGTEKAKQDDLLDCLKAMQTDQAIITPDTMIVELLEAARTSSVDSYEKWGNFWNTAITLVILGQEATTVGTPGKLGEETARSDVRQEYVKADADRLSEWLNDQSIRWIVDYNFPNVKKYPKFWKEVEPPEDLEKLSKVHQVILPMLDDVPMKFIHDTYSIPMPEGDEPVLIQKAAPTPFGFAENRKMRRYEGAKMRRYEDKKIRSCEDSNLHNFTTSHLHNFSSSFLEADWVSEYMKNLAPSLGALKKDALSKIEGWLRNQSSPPSEEEFTSAIKGILGDAYKNIDKIAVTESVGAIYQAYKAIEGLTATVGFEGADIRAINFLSNLDHFYLSKFIDNPDAQAALMDFLKTRYLEGGEGLFGAGDPKAIAELKNLLSQQMTDLEGYQINRIVDTGVVRIQNWSHISQLHDAAIAEIEIIEPTQECAFCAMMNGKIIQVDVAYKNMMDQANMTPDEYQTFLGENQSILENIQNYVDQGLLPPYHPHCRGTIVMRTTNQ
jgi:phage gp29-like protein